MIKIFITWSPPPHGSVQSVQFDHSDQLPLTVKFKSAFKSVTNWESVCGTVDSVVVSDSGGTGFESSHRQLLLNKFTVNCLL